MIKSSLFLLLLLTSIDVWSQITITGTVKAKGERYLLPGVNIVEKGTRNGIVSTNEGNFSITVANTNSILVFSYLGYVTEEIPINGQEHLRIRLKADCHVHFYDHQVIKINTTSGILHTPIGGGIEVSFPAFLRKTTLKSGISCQSDLNENRLINAHISFDHLVAECGLETDIRWYYRSVRWGNKLQSKAYSFESNIILDPFGFHNVGLVLGYSMMDFKKPETLENKFTSGPLLGLGAWIGGTLRVQVTGKVAVYKGLAEYQGEINREFKRVYTFARLYKLQYFTEVSVGIGIEGYFRFRSQKN